MKQLDQDSSASRWLVIEGDERRRVFVFRPEDEHTVLVGGSEGVHFHVPDAAPLCFYVERVGGDLFLVPAYVGHLRLNSHRVTERSRLPCSGIVEFGRYRLHLTVQAVPPHEDDVTVMLPFDPPPPSANDADYDEVMATRIAEFELPSDANDAPTAVLQAPGSSLGNDAADSVEFAPTEEQEVPHSEPKQVARPHQTRQPSDPPHHSAMLDDDDPALATQIMGSMPDFDEAFPNYQEPPALRVSPTVPAPADGTFATYQPAKTPRVALTASNPSDPTPTPFDTGGDRTEGIAFNDFVPPTGKSKAVLPTKTSDPARLETARPVSTPKAPIKSAMRQPRSSHAGIGNQVERFGIWAKQRPVLAIGGGVAFALVVGLTIGGLSKLLSAPPNQDALPVTAIAAVQESATGPAAAEEEPEDATKQAPRQDPSKAAPTGPAERTEEEEKKGTKKSDHDEAAAEARAAEEKAHMEDVNRAVEHLVAGRDDEAAHAYQSLAQTKYATEQTKRMSDFMQQRTNAGHKKKPASHQVPDLYR